MKNNSVKFTYVTFIVSFMIVINQTDNFAAEYKPWKYNSIFNSPPASRTIQGPTPPTPPVVPQPKQNYEPKESILRHNNEKNSTSNKEDKIERIAKEYYENGRLAQETPYRNGIKEGIQKIYRKNGKMNLTITYVKNSPVSGMCYQTNGTKTPLTNAELLNFENGLSIECD